MKRNSYLLFAFFFFLFLFWGVYSAGWYASGELRVKAAAVRGIADLVFRWDSGEGFNGYETREVLVNIPRIQNSPTQHIRIRALQEKDPTSESTTVSIIRILLDGKEFDLKKVRPRSIFHDRLAIQLTPKNPIYEFDAPVSGHIRIVFANSFFFGKVAVEINGVTSKYDLYTSSGRYDERPYDFYLVQPDGSFQFSLGLPQYRIKTLLIENKKPQYPVSFNDISLCNQENCEPLSFEQDPSGNQLRFREPNKALKRFFDPIRFLFRMVFAVASAAIACFLLSFIRQSGGVVTFFFHKDRRYFWALLFTFSLINGLILAPFWPGVMSQDSLVIWRASGLPDIYLNSHPILNMISYMYLRGIWNNPAVVPVTQIFLTSLLIAAIFERLRKSGVSVWLLTPFFLWLLCALPIFLYNTALWKDIPFALLVTAWGMFFVILREQRQIGSLSASLLCVVLLAYLGLGFFRYNGLVYLLVVPAFLVMTGPIDWKKSLIYSLLAITTASGILWAMKDIKTIGGLEFLTTALKQHTMFLEKTSLSHELLKAGEGYFQIFDMDKKGTVSDKWHYYLADRYSWKYLKETGLADYYRYLPQNSHFHEMREAIFRIYKASYELPWKYLIWNPVHMLVIMLLVILCFRWFPSAALFSVFLICGVIPLVALKIFNWRYYYFCFFGLYFIFPLILFDLQKKRGDQH
jgi:hypothetical protein